MRRVLVEDIDARADQLRGYPAAGVSLRMRELVGSHHLDMVLFMSTML